MGTLHRTNAIFFWNSGTPTGKFKLRSLDSHYFAQIQAGRDQRAYLEQRVGILQKMADEQREQLDGQAQELAELRQLKRQRLPSQEPGGLKGATAAPSFGQAGEATVDVLGPRPAADVQLPGSTPKAPQAAAPAQSDPAATPSPAATATTGPVASAVASPAPTATTATGTPDTTGAALGGPVLAAAAAAAPVTNTGRWLDGTQQPQGSGRTPVLVHGQGDVSGYLKTGFLDC